MLAATLTRDPVAVSVMGALAFLPWLLFALPAGTLVDRVNRRTAMATANVFRAALVAALAGSVASGHASLPLLYAVAFPLGCAETVYDSAARAMLPAGGDPGPAGAGQQPAHHRRERRQHLPRCAHRRLVVRGRSIAAAVGQQRAYLCAAFLALTVAGRFAVDRSGMSSVREDMVEGLSWLAHHRLLRELMAASFFGQRSIP